MRMLCFPTTLTPLAFQLCAHKLQTTTASSVVASENEGKISHGKTLRLLCRISLNLNSKTVFTRKLIYFLAINSNKMQVPLPIFQMFFSSLNFPFSFSLSTSLLISEKTLGAEKERGERKPNKNTVTDRWCVALCWIFCSISIISSSSSPSETCCNLNYWGSVRRRCAIPAAASKCRPVFIWVPTGGSWFETPCKELQSLNMFSSIALFFYCKQWQLAFDPTYVAPALRRVKIKQKKNESRCLRRRCKQNDSTSPRTLSSVNEFNHRASRRRR